MASSRPPVSLPTGPSVVAMPFVPPPTISASEQLSRLLKTNDDLSRMAAFESKLLTEKASVEGQIENLLSSQLAAITTGLSTLQTGSTRLDRIKENLRDIEQLSRECQTTLSDYSLMRTMGLSHKRCNATLYYVGELQRVPALVQKIYSTLRLPRKNQVSSPESLVPLTLVDYNERLLHIHYCIHHLAAFREKCLSRLCCDQFTAEQLSTVQFTPSLFQQMVRDIDEDQLDALNHWFEGFDALCKFFERTVFVDITSSFYPWMQVCLLQNKHATEERDAQIALYSSLFVKLAKIVQVEERDDKANYDKKSLNGQQLLEQRASLRREPKRYFQHLVKTFEALITERYTEIACGYFDFVELERREIKAAETRDKKKNSISLGVRKRRERHLDDEEEEEEEEEEDEQPFIFRKSEEEQRLDQELGEQEELRRKSSVMNASAEAEAEDQRLETILREKEKAGAALASNPDLIRDLDSLFKKLLKAFKQDLWFIESYLLPCFPAKSSTNYFLQGFQSHIVNHPADEDSNTFLQHGLFRWFLTAHHSAWYRVIHRILEVQSGRLVQRIVLSTEEREELERQAKKKEEKRLKRKNETEQMRAQGYTIDSDSASNSDDSDSDSFISDSDNARPSELLGVPSIVVAQQHKEGRKSSEKRPSHHRDRRESHRRSTRRSTVEGDSDRDDDDDDDENDPTHDSDSAALDDDDDNDEGEGDHRGRRRKKVRHVHQGKVTYYPLELKEILSILRWIRDYYGYLQSAYGLLTNEMQPLLLDDSVEDVLRHYVSLVHQKMVQWSKNLAMTEEKNFRDRIKPPPTDAAGHYASEEPNILFRLVNQQLEISVTSHHPRFVFDVTNDSFTTLLEYQQRCWALLNAQIAHYFAHRTEPSLPKHLQLKGVQHLKEKVKRKLREDDSDPEVDRVEYREPKFQCTNYISYLKFRLLVASNPTHLLDEAMLSEATVSAHANTSTSSSPASSLSSLHSPSLYDSVGGESPSRVPKKKHHKKTKKGKQQKNALPPGLFEYLMLMANSQYECTRLCQQTVDSLFEQETIFAEEPAYTTMLTPRARMVTHGFQLVCDYAIHLMIEMIFDDLKPILDYLFTSRWYSQKLNGVFMDTVLSTLEDYRVDIKKHVVPELYDHVMRCMAERLLLEYLDRLVNGKDAYLKLDKCLRLIVMDRDKLERFFKNAFDVSSAGEQQQQRAWLIYIQILTSLVEMLSIRERERDTFLAQIQKFYRKYPDCHWHVLERILVRRRDLEKAAARSLIQDTWELVKQQNLREPLVNQLEKPLSDGSLFSREAARNAIRPATFLCLLDVRASL